MRVFAAREDRFPPELRSRAGGSDTCIEVMPASLTFLFDVRLLALAGLVFGLLRGEMFGVAVALAAALCFGFALRPSFLGVSIATYTLTAFVAGAMARVLRRPGFVRRTLLFFVLLIVEQLLWNWIHHAFWPQSPMLMPWLSLLWTLLWTAALGSILFAMLAPRCRLELYEED